MAMHKGPRAPVANYVRAAATTAPRLCLWPERVPGVAPACEDDAIEDRRQRNASNWSAAFGGKHAPGSLAPVNLPERMW